MSLTSMYPENQYWPVLKPAIEQILKEKTLARNHEELYSNAYEMVKHKHNEQLYKGLMEIIQNHLEEHVRSCLFPVNDDLLNSLNKSWNEFQESIDKISGILSYFERNYLAQKQYGTIGEIGARLFATHVIKFNCLRYHVRDGLLLLILKKRKGREIDEVVFRNICQLFTGFDTELKDDFEKRFLQQSIEFYRIECRKFLVNSTALDYLRKAEQILNYEKTKQVEFIQRETMDKLLIALEDELILKQMKTISEYDNFGIFGLLDNQNIDDLIEIIKVISQYRNALDIFLEYLNDYVQINGESSSTSIKASLIELNERLLSTESDENERISFKLTNFIIEWNEHENSYQ